jgi:electron transport complex protein RnfG
MKHIIKPALSLFLITAIATALLGLVRNLTLEPIENQRKRTQERIMKEVLPMASDFREISVEKSGYIVRILEGTIAGETTGFVIELSPVGYSGIINMMVGISKADNKITGMRVIRHSETPGLGALAVNERFYNRFNGKELVPLRVVRTSSGSHDEIEAITAATITTRAITNAVNEATEWYNRNLR